MLPVLAAIAWEDYRTRNIPHHYVAAAFAIFPFSIGQNMAVMAFSLIGLAWLVHIATTELKRRKVMPWLVKEAHFGLGDALVMPMMIVACIQAFGGFGFFVWWMGTFTASKIWRINLKPKDRQKRMGIPLLFFAFVMLMLMYYLKWIGMFYGLSNL